MTPADRAAALRALEQRALAAGLDTFAFLLHLRADLIGSWSEEPRDQKQTEARKALMDDACVTMRSQAEAARVAEHEARVAAELAEAALAVLEAE